MKTVSDGVMHGVSRWKCSGTDVKEKSNTLCAWYQLCEICSVAFVLSHT